MLICPHSVCAGITAEMRSPGGDRLVCKAKNVHCLVLDRRSWLIPGFEGRSQICIGWKILLDLVPYRLITATTLWNTINSTLFSCVPKWFHIFYSFFFYRMHLLCLLLDWRIVASEFLARAEFNFQFSWHLSAVFVSLVNYNRELTFYILVKD